MKLTPEQIRERVKQAVGILKTPEQAEAEVLRIIEDTTGEKLPEPFDERRVEHLSVWQTKLGVLVVLRTDGWNKDQWFVAYSGGTISSSEFPDYSSKAAIIEKLRDIRAKYMGTYNFAAGYQKP